jgi:hypothetical protein
LSEFKEGQLVRVIANLDPNNPHDIPIGTMAKIVAVWDDIEDRSIDTNYPYELEGYECCLTPGEIELVEVI